MREKIINEAEVSRAGKIYSVGCLPILLAWLLLDLICRAIIWGIASLFGKEVPVWSTAVRGTAYAILILLGAIFAAALIWMLYVHVSEWVGSIFHKDKKNKGSENQKAE
jgi:hypothetical protein